MIVKNKQANIMRCCGPMPCGIINPKKPPERVCVGDKCMAWRNNPISKTLDPEGFCGLAGQHHLDRTP